MSSKYIYIWLIINKYIFVFSLNKEDTNKFLTRLSDKWHQY